MVTEIQGRLDKYLAWLKDRTALREVGEYVEITTPYLDRHNDYLQIYVRRQNGSFLLTDDGYVLTDLEQSGCEMETKKRKQLLMLTLSGFGVKQEGKALQVSATPENFALKKHNLVQAMLAVNDMFYLAQSTVSGIFLEDVASWLDMREIRYTPSIKFTGKSGLDHRFNFVIPKSKISPERILQAVNQPNKDSATLLAFAWLDTKEVRSSDSKAFALLNDQERVVPIEVTERAYSHYLLLSWWFSPIWRYTPLLLPKSVIALISSG